ncbi:uncharacterized protein LOC144438603 isoform X2 [Glandiceps talaboti]
MSGIRRRSSVSENFYQPIIDAKVFEEYGRPENYQGATDAILLVSKLQAQEEAKGKEEIESRVESITEKADIESPPPRPVPKIRKVATTHINTDRDDNPAVDEDRRDRLLRLGLDPDIEFPFPSSIVLTSEQKVRFQRVPSRKQSGRSGRERKHGTSRCSTPYPIKSCLRVNTVTTPRFQISPNPQSANRSLQILRQRYDSPIGSPTNQRGEKPNSALSSPNITRKMKLSNDFSSTHQISTLRRCKSDSDIYTSACKINLSVGGKGTLLRHSWEKISGASKSRAGQRKYLAKAIADIDSFRSHAKSNEYASARQDDRLVSTKFIKEDVTTENKRTELRSEEQLVTEKQMDVKSTPLIEKPTRELSRRRSSVGYMSRRSSVVSDDGRSVTSTSRRSSISIFRLPMSEGTTDLPGSASARRHSISVRGTSSSRRLRFTVYDFEKLMEQRLAKERFQRAIRLVITLVRVFNMIQSRPEKEVQSRGQLTFTEIAEQFQSEDMKNSGLSFNPKDFKANREINISNEVKSILSMPNDQRSTEQLQTALYGLQTMKSFAEYPLHMQEKLTRVAWFENIPPKKIIIRQGHYAEAFYFVISGSAVVTIMETNQSTGETTMRTATVLRKGSSFGELALLHHSVRTATVSSQGPVQLLAIGREDFFDIFMRGQRPGEEPEHITFLRQIDSLKNFPFEKLKEHPEKCLFHFYKRGQVIVKDSNNSEWLYVVKSGACQVLKQLKAVKPLDHRPRGFKLPHIDELCGGASTGRHSGRLTNLSSSESPRNRRNTMLSDKASSDEIIQPALDPNKENCNSTRARERREKAVFVQLELLHPKDVFGLNTVPFDEDLVDAKQASVHLISRGAECIMMHKDFFVKHANDNVRRAVRLITRPYPPTETLQEHLQDFTNWNHFKKETVQTVLMGGSAGNKAS